jgi:hypothetical protein
MKKITEIIISALLSGVILSGCSNSTDYVGQYRNRPYRLELTSSEGYKHIVLTDTTRNDQNHHPTITGVKLNDAWREIKQWNFSPDDSMEKYANADSLNKIITYRGGKNVN